MIKYECDMCDMCRKIFFNTNDIDAYKIPEAYTFEPDGSVWITLHFGAPTSMELKTVHLCKDCAKKFVEITNIVVDK